ncbi:hypothetical protein LB516_21230 [Mesorhizobium sp. CO1-1-7]|nr:MULTISPECIES: hypothetical protein [unclassified Mesorhizobium]MBZ9905462.1 hypothetical protein [Mesorhizobium sp. BR115XR7A]MBZ9929588.1 hypothetical protein [Mesorhizobium sp. BR1-1-5]MBZ9747765.1 hypothetical protein [Mesorhizobium sp. CO1-1-7]TPJ13840.1 hypothetical protein FJW04_19830 [Mesorhizobium sp. B2-7-3]TPL81312.1 hypothetical protein FJ950_23995 [Mesorhizobium sp. B2-3-14]
MRIGDFDTGRVKHSPLYRDAKLAMLTHQVLYHMQLTETAVSGVEHALVQFAQATKHPAHDAARRSLAAFLHLEPDQTLGM